MIRFRPSAARELAADVRYYDAQRAERGQRFATEVASIAQEVTIALRESAASSNATGQPMLAAVRSIGRTLDFALEEARDGDRPLYLLFVREQPVLVAEDRKRKWQEDEEAREIFTYASSKANGVAILPCYAVSDAPAETIADLAATVGASRLILGAPRRSGLVNLLRGNLVRQVADILPDDIHMLVYA